ncbi:DNA polymerase III subunit beta [Streptomyces macrosporus]|uniref:DNA polymerase III beta sliding clamp central domain-containing protein n=1 Tax=Streptomyces macrosporus TaxID=44032 RepID=A0ABP5WS02_9ACTN
MDGTEALMSIGTFARPGGAGAVRQVAPAVASAPVREEFPVLGCVLIDIERQEVRLVATDRYRLAVRALRPLSAEGGPRRVLVGASELKDVASWAGPLPDVDIEVDRRGVRLHGGRAARALPTVDETFPDYRMILDDLPAARHRIIADRTALRAAIAEAGHDGPLTLRTDERRLTLAFRGSATATLPAVCTGAPVRIAFDPGVLPPALDAGVGPDALPEISSPTRPVVVRPADQGSFTTLVMPVHEAPTAA